MNTAFRLRALLPWLTLGFLTACAPGPDWRRCARGPSDEMFLVTCAVGSERVQGTGFLLAVPAPGRTGNIPILVTSSHLVRAAEREPIYVLLRAIGDGGEAYASLVELPAAGRADRCASHPSLDVTVFRLDLPADLPRHAILPALPESALTTGEGPAAGAPVSVIGFPAGASGPSGLLPLSRRGDIASLEQTAFGLPVFLINAAVFPGDSGSPVFALGKTRDPSILGMVVEYVSDTDGHPLPLALAVRASAIRDTIKLLVAHSSPTPAPTEALPRPKSAGRAPATRP